MRSVMTTSVLVVLALGACSRGPDRDSSQPAADSAVMPAPAAADAGEKVDVDFSEWKISSSRDTIPGGQVTFLIRNSGTMPHVVEISGNGNDWKSMPVAPGDAITMATVLDAGQYRITCPDSAGAHQKRGMQAVISVTPKR